MTRVYKQPRNTQLIKAELNGEVLNLCARAWAEKPEVPITESAIRNRLKKAESRNFSMRQVLNLDPLREEQKISRGVCKKKNPSTTHFENDVDRHKFETSMNWLRAAW